MSTEVADELQQQPRPRSSDRALTLWRRDYWPAQDQRGPFGEAEPHTNTSNGSSTTIPATATH